MEQLARLKCVACRADAPPATAEEMAAWLPQVPDWAIVEREGAPNLQRVFKFKNFAQALAFTERVGELAEAEGHHPDILTQWGRVTIWWSTHKIKQLHRNDFIMAARTDEAFREATMS